MFSALVAIDPAAESGKSLDRFTAIVRLFQKQEIISRTSIVSAIHAALYAVPHQWYRKMKSKFAKGAKLSIGKACAGRFDFTDVKVLQSDDQSNEGLASKLARYGRRHGYNLFVVSSNERAGLPHWILGSFSETAAFTAPMSVLVIKPHLTTTDFPTLPRFVVSVDVAARPSRRTIQRVGKLAKNSGARIDLVYVEPRPRALVDPLQERPPKKVTEEVMKDIARDLREAGAPTTIEILREKKSIAHEIVEFAEEREAWMTITLSAERSTIRKLLLGSNARRILSMTKRPFLNLRLE